MNAALDRIETVLEEEELPDTGKKHIPVQSDAGQPEISFDNVAFAYQDKGVLHDISFTMKRNTMTALVGPKATASVDTDNESYIQEAICELVKGKTLLIIAHRLNTIQSADQILVIADGEVKKEAIEAIGRIEKHAVKELKKRGLIEKTIDGEILLTEDGKRIASKIYERHCFFHDLLYEAGIDEQTAQREACRMEHTVTEESFQKLKERFGNIRSQKKTSLRNSSAKDTACI